MRRGWERVPLILKVMTKNKQTKKSTKNKKRKKKILKTMTLFNKAGKVGKEGTVLKKVSLLYNLKKKSHVFFTYPFSKNRQSQHIFKKKNDQMQHCRIWIRERIKKWDHAWQPNYTGLQIIRFAWLDALGSVR